MLKGSNQELAGEVGLLKNKLEQAYEEKEQDNSKEIIEEQ